MLLIAGQAKGIPKKAREKIHAAYTSNPTVKLIRASDEAAEAYLFQKFLRTL
jgi:hypothetical protein